ncbi:acylneuraminate cytidylyltransferase family protein [uncultured Vagococcus sp.]|uniref:acylneuraminate cytidylyltransferase family protein n=1 Tax=uncultured Vagococcus sp. TaxID=189676 RepID=UPI0028D1756D|nr:acylneuraminate cytidylyltransferase family protein [uncultured Vagococcus sp.]
MSILITICGRAGSKGLANKNLKEFYGKPLIAYTLSAIDLLQKEMGLGIDVVLNTDSEDLQRLALEYYPVLLVTRKEALANDTASKISVIQDTYFQSKNMTNREYDFVIDLDITSPLRTVADIKQLIQQKIKNRGADVIFSVVNARRNPFFNMVKRDSDGNVSLVVPSNYTARQQAPSIYEMNASMYLYDVAFLRKDVHIFDGICDVIEMKDYLILDIDSEEDFSWMEYLYPKHLEEDSDLKDIYEHIDSLKENKAL